jgi:hypothetical protein
MKQIFTLQGIDIDLQDQCSVLQGDECTLYIVICSRVGNVLIRNENSEIRTWIRTNPCSDPETGQN